MKLIGMLDSPYVRRVAVDLQLLGVPFEHEPLSVFRTFDEFAAANPVVKAPTLVADDGTVLMDSTLIAMHAQSLAPRRRLWPDDPHALARDLRLVGLALAACEKCVQIVYEQRLRPPEKVHEPWLERVRGQLLAACRGIDDALRRHPPALGAGAIGDAAVTAAVAWTFIRRTRPDEVPEGDFPALAALAAAAETLPAFVAAPHGDGRVERHRVGNG